MMSRRLGVCRGRFDPKSENTPTMEPNPELCVLAACANPTAGLSVNSEHGSGSAEARASLWLVGLPWRAKGSSMKKMLSAGVAAETQKLVLTVNPTEMSAGSGGVASYWYVRGLLYR